MNSFFLYGYHSNGDIMKILITGASSGIGHDLAKVLAFRGHRVYACCHTVSQVKMMSFKKEENIEYLKLDITNPSDYEIVSNLGIDCLVNLAGMGVGGSLLDLNMEDVRKNFEVNVFGTLALSQYFLHYCFDEARIGKILITSSLVGELPIPFTGCYAATKASLTMIGKILKWELKIAGWKDMKVRLILPGAYRTGFNQQMLNYIDKSKFFKSAEDCFYGMRFLFSLAEKKTTHSIVNKMVKAIESESSRLVYVAPCSQNVMTRLYRIFFW